VGDVGDEGFWFLSGGMGRPSGGGLVREMEVFIAGGAALRQRNTSQTRYSASAERQSVKIDRNH
jgi:hypothetical protein